MIPYFEKLGNTVLAQWEAKNCSLAEFPKLAEAVIKDAPPAEHVNLEDMIHEFLSSADQPTQGHSGFGQPELIAYNSEHFYIQILFWMEGTTKIHQHGFSGAFHVMYGSSVHSEYEFLNAQQISENLNIGDLKLRQIDLLDAGRTVPIVSGTRCIHSLFHLDSPSVTVVVRTHHDEGSGPQFNYLPPHIAIDPLYDDTLTQRRTQLLDVLDHLGSEDYLSRVSSMIEELDFEPGFHTLHHVMPRLLDLGVWEAMLDKFQTKHGALADGVANTLQEELRREYISQLRYQIEHPEHRFFLALLMNAQNSRDILSLIADRYPDQTPVDTVIRWAQELIEANEYGLALLDAEFPDILDADMDTQFDLLMSTLSQALTETPIENKAVYHALSHSCLSPLFK